MVELQGRSENERLPYWDNIKGFLIFLVVFGHFLWGYIDSGIAGYIVKLIYIFHMPAFIFVSGFLSKSDNARSKQSIVKLVAIYLFFNTAIMLVSFIVFKTSFQLLTPNYSFWFLLSLIVWRLAAKYVPKSNIFILVSVIAAILVGLWKDVTNVLAIARTIAFFPFFYIGFKLPAEKFNHFIHHRKPRDYIKGSLILLYTIIISVLFMLKYSWLDQGDFLMESFNSTIDVIVRITILSVAGLMTTGILMVMPLKPIPVLNQWGKNSICIYVLHRFFTFAFIKAFPTIRYSELYILLAFAASLLTTFALGSNTLTRKFNQFIHKAIEFFTLIDENGKPKKPIRIIAIASLLITCLLLPTLYTVWQPVQQAAVVPQTDSSDIIHPVMTQQQQAALEGAVSIAFVGDLILLQDQVRNAYNAITGEYDFNPMFEYAQKYLSEADFAIGIFEGPTAGEEAGYSTSNYGDGLPLYLNYPDSFASAVKASGIDLVSTANNHLLDKGEKGVIRTLDVLDGEGLLHVGSYRNQAEKASIPVIELKGIRIALLAYTYGSNYYTEDYFLHQNPSLTSALTDPSGEKFEEVKATVLADFEGIHEMENPPDLIAVLPHMGTQFSHATDSYQDAWNKIFVEAGADIILGDHAHAVQPIEFRKATGKDGQEKHCVIVNCPGNFANSYIEEDGDATAIVEIYLDPQNKSILCAGVISMYTQSTVGGNYRALPVYSILNNTALHKEISRFELQRVNQVHSTVTSVMLGTPLALDQARERHFLFPQGYIRQAVAAIAITDDMRSSFFYKLLSESKSVCFVGDSITEGTKNGGYGWYEPLMAAFPDSVAYKRAWSSATTMTLLDNGDEISHCSADLYVIAIGTNDVRYRDEKICAMTDDGYIANIKALTDKILLQNPDAEFVFINPWLARDNDPYTKVAANERDALLDKYGQALQSFCEREGYGFINPNPAIDAVLTKHIPSDYLLDHIHPNAGEGIALYSEKVLSNGK